MATQPAFAATPRCAVGALSVANTGRDGTGTLATVLTAGANGSRLERISIKAKATTTAGTIRLFLHDGTTATLWREVLVSAITASATVAAFEQEIALGDTGIVLPSGWSLRASTEKAELFNVTAWAGDF